MNSLIVSVADNEYFKKLRPKTLIKDVTKSIYGSRISINYLSEKKFITGQNEREESTQNTTVTNSAAIRSKQLLSYAK